MKSIAEFDAELSELCKNDDMIFGNFCLKCIATVLGTMMLPLCMLEEFIGFIAPVMMLYFACNCHLQPRLYYSTEKGPVSVYTVLQYTPLKREDFIKDRIRSLLSFGAKLAIAGEILVVLTFLLHKDKDMATFVDFLAESVVIYIIVFLFNIISIYISTSESVCKS